MLETVGCSLSGSGSGKDAEDERESGSSSVAVSIFSVILEATPQLGIALRKSGGEWHTRRPAMEMMDPGRELGRSR